MSRPTIYTDELAVRICELMEGGESLNRICRRPDMPGRSTVHLWLQRNKDFRAMYETAREVMLDLMADELLEIADDSAGDVKFDSDGNPRPNNEFINRSRLRVDTRKWILSKLLPKKYGDKITQEVQGAGGEPLGAVIHLTVGAQGSAQTEAHGSGSTTTSSFTSSAVPGATDPGE